MEGLLLLARAEAGVLRMDRQEVDLGQVFEGVYLRLKPLADSHKIELRLGTIEPLSIQGDRERLQRMTSNLLDNAIKYTGAEGRVTLGLQHDSRWAYIIVSDTGNGIPIEEQKHIFQAFYRTSQARSPAERGTGLGLTIAQSIAAAHGGTIQVESTPGRGSSFRVRIPVTSARRFISVGLNLRLTHIAIWGEDGGLTYWQETATFHSGLADRSF